MAQRSDDGEAGRVRQVAVVRQDVHVDADGPALLPGHQAERLGVEGTGAANSLFEQPGKKDFGFGGPVHFEVRRGHGREFGGDGEDAV